MTQLIIGFGLISSSKVEAYTGYVQLENAQTGRAADHNSGSPQILPKQENLVAVNGGLNAELSSGAGRTHKPLGPR